MSPVIHNNPESYPQVTLKIRRNLKIDAEKLCNIEVSDLRLKLHFCHRGKLLLILEFDVINLRPLNEGNLNDKDANSR